MNYKHRIRTAGLFILLLFLSLCFVLPALALLTGVEARAEAGTESAGAGNTAFGTDDLSAEVPTARPSVNGHLHVEGAQLVDENGTAVQLRGISTHGLTWYSDFLLKTIPYFVDPDSSSVSPPRLRHSGPPVAEYRPQSSEDREIKNRIRIPRAGRAAADGMPA